MDKNLKERYEDLSLQADLIREQMRCLRSDLRLIRQEMADIRDEAASKRLGKHLERYCAAMPERITQPPQRY